MRRSRRLSWFDGASASALLALSVAVTLPASAAAETAPRTAIEAAIPTPEPADVAPLTAKDVEPPAEEAAAEEASAAPPATAAAPVEPEPAASADAIEKGEAPATAETVTEKPAPAAEAVPVPAEPATETAVQAADPAPPAAAETVEPAAAETVETVTGAPAGEPASAAAPAEPAAEPSAEAAEPAPVTTSAVPPAPAAGMPEGAEAALPGEDEAETEDDVARSIPVPEPADVAPPTAADLGDIPLPVADQAVAERLRELVGGNFGGQVAEASDRQALKAFYEGRDFAPLFSEFGRPNERMKATVARLREAEADGLNPDDYETRDPARLDPGPDALAEAELALQNAVLTFARHAQSGRVNASRISPNIDVKPEVPQPAAILAKVSEAGDVAAALDSFNPPHEGFKRLRAKLAELRGGVTEERPVIFPEGRLLRPGMQDDRVPVLRQRLKVDGEPGDTTYDEALAEAVREFQRANRLQVDGLVGARTVAVLNGGRSDANPVEAIVSNMERWRWIPRELGRNHVWVNVPDFTMHLVRGNQRIFDTRIVVGRPGHPTPIFSDNVRNIQINPTWHVPQSIIYRDYLPALERDPSAMQRMGIIVQQNNDGTIQMRQPPGPRNALGRLKFNFPNQFQVYLHDTPDRHLFGRESRAYSAGCIRVQNPDVFAEKLLAISLPGEGYTAQRLARMYGPNEQWVRFKQTVPIHLVYMNAYVDDAGELVVRPDVYGYDGRVQAALRGQYLAVNERSQRVNPTQVRRDYRLPEQRRVADRPAQQDPYQQRYRQAERHQQQQQQPFFFFPFFR